VPPIAKFLTSLSRVWREEPAAAQARIFDNIATLATSARARRSPKKRGASMLA